MKIRTLGLIYLLLATGVFNCIFAEETNLKFGKINKENLEVTSCPIDENAHAYFIFDDGQSSFVYANTTIDSRSAGRNKGFQLHFNRHFRIKIIDNQGYGWANIEIPLYHNDNSKEEITKLKAYTYNLEKGKIIKTKLDRGDIRLEESGENWDTQKFAMPNITDGTIIEVEYTVVSDFFFNLQEWFFQRSIPTMQSHYRVEIPEYFNYNMSEGGYFPIHKTEDRRRRELKLTFLQADRIGSVDVNKYEQTIDYNEEIHEFLGENIPAFPNEQFVKTKKNFLSRVEFELNYTNFENQSIHYYTTSWNEIDENLNKGYDFGRELSRTNHLKDDVENLKSLNLDQPSLINAAFALIKQKVNWNGIRSKYVTSSLGRAYKDGSGNCADVNLNLVVLLRELGFDSDPVILSTREHGIISLTHPSVSSFNYVIAMVNYENAAYLLDATDPFSEINLLPIRCLNDKGRIIGNAPEKWINLMDYKSYFTSSTYNLSFDDDFAMHGKIVTKFKDYGAYQTRIDIKGTNDLEEYTQKLEKQSGDGKIENLTVNGMDSLTENLYLSYDIIRDHFGDVNSNMVYFSPVFDPFFKENPFKLEKREFPVEFNYPYQIQQVYNISIPDEYQIEEIPKTIIVRLPDNSGKFYFQVTQMNKLLHVSTLLSLSKSMFLPKEYGQLKQFFQMIIDKQNELVVLKSI